MTAARRNPGEYRVRLRLVDDEAGEEGDIHCWGTEAFCRLMFMVTMMMVMVSKILFLPANNPGDVLEVQKISHRI